MRLRHAKGCAPAAIQAATCEARAIRLPAALAQKAGQNRTGATLAPSPTQLRRALNPGDPPQRALVGHDQPAAAGMQAVMQLEMCLDVRDLGWHARVKCGIRKDVQDGVGEFGHAAARDSIEKPHFPVATLSCNEKWCGSLVGSPTSFEQRPCGCCQA